jgi:hypothetical protein
MNGLRRVERCRLSAEAKVNLGDHSIYIYTRLLAHDRALSALHIRGESGTNLGALTSNSNQWTCGVIIVTLDHGCGHGTMLNGYIVLDRQPLRFFC